jgi:hypothetical protein
VVGGSVAAIVGGAVVVGAAVVGLAVVGAAVVGAAIGVVVTGCVVAASVAVDVSTRAGVRATVGPTTTTPTITRLWGLGEAVAVVVSIGMFAT